MDREEDMSADFSGGNRKWRKDTSGVRKPVYINSEEDTGQGSPEPSKPKRIRSKSPLMAAVLSLFMVGLGHVYSGKTRKGILLFGFLVLLAFSGYFIAVQFEILAGVYVAAGLLHLYAFVDAFRILKKNPQSKLGLNRDATYVAVVLAYLFLLQLLPRERIKSHAPIQFAKMPVPVMSPALQAGDEFAYRKQRGAQRGEVVVFRNPYDEDTETAMRAVGSPGDHLELREGLAYINGDLADKPGKLKFQYFIAMEGPWLSHEHMQDFGIDQFVQAELGLYLVEMTPADAQRLAQSALVQEVEKIPGQYLKVPKYPLADLGWTLDNYGPLYIPHKGGRIILSQKNLLLYGDVIRQENPGLVIRRKHIEIDGQKLEEYRFKENYYFMLGDNRHGVEDSRQWGLLAEGQIRGRALYIFWSDHPGRIGADVE